ncbi:hypothetical protein CRV08_14040 [Halarcobacter ebronensis]|uniref:Uncharacterized protein n=1 Tax=Halarcobacter ebronensis TaxID=1462615 RepID=A0A4Q0Y7M3_9BACT|nr:hypothetical protein [Halarcobacter ebronensis]RXJ65863.1 hypothetical protein CRV08_14040 [Halarcobacter ebronensis]
MQEIINISKVWGIVEMLYQYAINYKIENQNDLDKLVGIVAQIHWWLSHSMPYLRGSAAISDMFTKIIFQYHNIFTPFWKAGIASDLEAFCMPLEEYIKNYQNLFESPFKSII